MKTFVRSLAAHATALATALAMASAAHAATVNYEFSVTIDTAGTLYSGQTFLGSFAYDDLAPTGVGPGGEALYALTDYSFVFDGPYTLTDLFYADAAFGSRFIGLDAGAANFAFLPEIGGGAPFFAFDFGAPDAGNGSIDYRRVVSPIAEPLSASLVAIALAGLLGHGRRGARRQRR